MQRHWGRVVLMLLLAVAGAVLGVAATAGCGGTPSTVVTVTASPSSASGSSASDNLEGWWVESDPITDSGWSPTLFYVEASGEGAYSVNLQPGVVLGVSSDAEEFIISSTGSGYETTDSTTTSYGDYRLEVIDPDTVNLTNNALDDPSPTQFVRATENEAAAALAAGKAAKDDGGSDSGSDGGAGLSSSEYKAKCRTVEFKVLDKDADDLVGKKYTFKGQVFQIQDAGKGSYFSEFEEAGYDVQPRTQVLLSVKNEGYGYWGDEICVLYADKMKKVYEEDIIQVWGECLGSYTYESVAGYNITVPLIDAEYYDKK